MPYLAVVSIHRKVDRNLKASILRGLSSAGDASIHV